MSTKLTSRAKAWLDLGLRRVDRGIALARLHVKVWMFHSVLVGIGLGIAALWLAKELDYRPTMKSPRLDAVWAICGALLNSVGVLAFGLIRSRLKSTHVLLRSARRLSRRGLFVLSLPILMGLTGKIAAKQPFLAIAYGVLCGLFVGAAVYQLRSWKWLESKPSRIAAWMALVGLFFTYAIAMSTISVNNFLSFNMGRSDMGYYVNILRQTSVGNFLGCSLCGHGTHYAGGHFDPILALLVPFYWIYPDGVTLLIIQAVWLGSSLLPLYLWCRHQGVGTWGSVGVGICFVLFPALHGVNLFDFHSLSLCVPLAIWVVYFLEKQHRLGFYLCLALLLSVREDMALLTMFIGLYGLLKGGPERGRMSWIAIVSAVAYLLVVKGWIMGRPDLLNVASDTGAEGKRQVSGYGGFYEDLIPKGGTTLDLVANLISRPTVVLQHVLEEKKLLYVTQLLAPLMFLPLFAKRMRVTLVYGAAFTLLASRPYLYTVHFQYSSVLIPFLFMGTGQVLGQLRRGRLGHGWRSVRLYRGLLLSAIVTSACVSWNFGGFVPNQTFKGGFDKLRRSPKQAHLDRAKWVRSLCDRIPEGAVLAANSNYLAHLGRCTNVVINTHRKRADYLLQGGMGGRDSKARQVAAEEKRGYLKELDRFGNNRFYKTAYPKKKKSKRTRRNK